MLPPDERLGAHHLAVVEVHERLVEEPQLAALESVLKLLLDRELLDGALAHRHVEQLRACAAALLRAVHRSVGVLHQARGIHIVPRLGHRDPDAGAEAQLGAARVHRLGELPLKPVRDADGLEYAADRLAEDGELVAAEASHGVLGTDCALDARGHLAEDLVAGTVAEAVVDPLEAVDVEEVDGRGVTAAAAIDRVREPVTEEGAVGQTGEGVVERQALELSLHALAVGHVEEDAEEERRLSVLVAAYHRHLVADPHEAAVRTADSILLYQRLARLGAIQLVRDHTVRVVGVKKPVPEAAFGDPGAPARNPGHARSTG